MTIRDTIITDTGIVIDPDDDMEFIHHINLYEFVHDAYSIYCNEFYPYKYD